MNLSVGLLFVSRKLIVASLALGYPANGTFAGWFVGEGSVPVLRLSSRVFSDCNGLLDSWFV